MDAIPITPMRKQSWRNPYKPRVTPKYAPTEVWADGIRFQSPLQARHYVRLTELRDQGKIAGFARNVRLDTGCGTVATIDWLVWIAGCTLGAYSKTREGKAVRVMRERARKLHGLEVMLWPGDVLLPI